MVNVTGNRTLSIIFLSILINRDTGLVLINMMVIQDGGYSKYRRNFCVIWRHVIYLTWFTLRHVIYLNFSFGRTINFPRNTESESARDRPQKTKKKTIIKCFLIWLNSDGYNIAIKSSA